MALPQPLLFPSVKNVVEGDWGSLKKWMSEFSAIARKAWGRIADEIGDVTEQVYEVKIIHFPEYVGATFAATPGGANAGYMLTDSEVDGNFRWNYYWWYSDQSTLQNYDIVFQYKIPLWSAGVKKLTVDLWTGSANALITHVDVELHKDGTALYSTLENLVSDDDSWKAERTNNAVAVFTETDTVLKELEPGNFLNVRITLNSKNLYDVTVGAITIEFKEPVIK